MVYTGTAFGQSNRETGAPAAGSRMHFGSLTRSESFASLPAPQSTIRPDERLR